MRAENKLEQDIVTQDTVTNAVSADIMKSIFYGFFKPNELTKLRKVCKTWHNLITRNLKDYNNNPAWHQLCVKFNPGKSSFDAFESLVNSINQLKTLSTSQLFTKTMKLVDILEQFQQDETREKIYREALVKGNLNLLHYLQTCVKHLELHFFYYTGPNQISEAEKDRVVSLSTYHIFVDGSDADARYYLGYCNQEGKYKQQLITDPQILKGVKQCLIEWGLRKEILQKEPTNEEEMIAYPAFVAMMGKRGKEERLDISCEDNIKILINQMVKEHNGKIAQGLPLADTLITYDDNPDKQLCKTDNPYKKILLPPLMLAALLGHTKLVEYFLSQGANLFCVAITDTDEPVQFHVIKGLMSNSEKWIDIKPEIKYMLLFAYVENLYHGYPQELTLSPKYGSHCQNALESTTSRMIPQRSTSQSLKIIKDLIQHEESEQFFLSYIDRVEKTGKGYQVEILSNEYKKQLAEYKKEFYSTTSCTIS